MTVPDHVQQLIDVALVELRADPEHRVPLDRRIALYRAFGNDIDFSGSILSRFLETGELTISASWYRYSWLAILTAQKVLPIWEDGTRRLLEYDYNEEA